jgi:hypothetical protein
MAINLLPLDATAGTPAFTAQQTRQALASLFGMAPGGRPLGASSGVRPGTPAATVFLTGAGSTTWNVAAHAGALDTQTSALAGPYAYATTGGDTGSITAADATNPRVDIVYVKVNDNTQDGSGLASGTIGYLAGTPAASPSAPATPARAMVLATIAVPKVGSGAPAATWTAPVFDASPSAYLYRSIDASHGSTGTWLYVSLDAVDQADAGITYTSGGDITIAAGGVYALSCLVVFAGDATGRRGARVLHNGTVIRQHQIYASGASSIGVEVAITRRLAAGDIIHFDAYQESGGALAVRGGLSNTSASLTRVGN